MMDSPSGHWWYPGKTKWSMRRTGSCAIWGLSAIESGHLTKIKALGGLTDGLLLFCSQRHTSNSAVSTWPFPLSKQESAVIWREVFLRTNGCVSWSRTWAFLERISVQNSQGASLPAFQRDENITACRLRGLWKLNYLALRCRDGHVCFIYYLLRNLSKHCVLGTGKNHGWNYEHQKHKRAFETGMDFH